MPSTVTRPGCPRPQTPARRWRPLAGVGYLSGPGGRLLALALLLSLPALAGRGLDTGDAEPAPTEPPTEPAPAETPPPHDGRQLVPALIRGKVLERGSGLPLAGAKVSSETASDTTNADGVFALLVPPADAVKVHVEAEDHTPIDVTERLAPGDTVDVVYRVDKFTWGQEAVTVYGEEHREEVSHETFTADELKLVPGSFGDPIRALQSLPGVARPATVEGDIVVRGAEALNTGTYVDEIPIPYLFHFFIGRSVVNPALLDDVEFYPGGMPSRFGDVTQAVVNARTLDTDPKPGVHGKVSADLLDFAASSEGRYKGLFWQGGYRLSWISGVLGGAVEAYSIVKGITDFRPPYPTLSYEDHLLRVGWKQGQDRVVGTFLGARDAFILHPGKYKDEDGDWHTEDFASLAGLDLPYDPYRLMDSGFERVQLRWDHTGDDGAEHVTWVAAGPDRKSSLLQGFGQLGDGIEFGKVSGWTIVGRRRDRFVLDDHDVLQAGVDVDVQPVRVDDWRDLDENGDWPVTKDARSSLGVWGEWQRTIGKTWVSPGLRLAGHTWADQWRLGAEPRLSLRETLNERWTGTAFVGRFTQVPPADRYADGVGNPDVGIMSAWQASVGAEGRWPSGLEANATLYASRTDDLIVKDTKIVVEPEEETAADGGYGYDGVAYSNIIPYYRTTTGYAYGIETMLRIKPTGKMFGWIAFTAGKSIRLDEDGTVHPGDYDLPLSLTIVGERDLPKDWRLSGRVRFTSGYPFTPLYGVYDVETDSWEGLSGDANDGRFPWFRQLDLRVDKTWTAKRARWTLYLDTYNTLNTKNWFLATYTPNYSKLEPEIWIPIIPTLGLEVGY